MVSQIGGIHYLIPSILKFIDMHYYYRYTEEQILEQHFYAIIFTSIMDDSQDIRWLQRFQNYQKAFDYLAQAIAIEKPDFLQRAGLIQFFEMTFELAWKTLKDYAHNAFLGSA